MVRKIIIAGLLVFTGITAVLVAQERGSVFEGTASMSRYGEFPASGFYAGSNSFQRNTIVEVENLENGKKISVIVTDRLNNPGLFMLLSKEAAATLGLPPDGTVRVRVRRERALDGLADELLAERAYTADPDLNPSAAVERYAADPRETGEQEGGPESPRLSAVAESPAARRLGRLSIAEPSAPAVREREPETEPEPGAEQPEIDLPETPRLSGATGSPAARRLGRVPLAEPRQPEITETEIVQESPDAPALTAVAGAPEIRALGAVALAEPEAPEEPVEAVERTETPRLSDVRKAPGPRGLGAVVLAEPGQPAEVPAEEPEIAEVEEPEIEEGSPRLTAIEESPSVEALGAIALTEPEMREPESEIGAEAPALLTMNESPETEELELARVTLPEEPSEQPRTAVREEGPAIAQVQASPVRRPSTELTGIAGLDEPVPADEKKAEIVEETEAVEDIEDEGPRITMTAERSPGFPLAEDEMLVLEPAEPRPPEIVTPESVDVPGSDKPKTDGSLKEIESKPHSPEAPKDAEVKPLIAEGEEKIDRVEEKQPDTRLSREERIRELETASRLEKGAFYVQLGVYSEAENANQIAAKFGGAYPVEVLREATAAKAVYKVLLGPVNQDESGGLLYNFRMKGYKDAFIRKGQ